MADINFWKENIRPAQVTTNIQNLLRDLDTYDTEIQESVLDNDIREVATTIAGYIIAKKLVAR